MAKISKISEIGTRNIQINETTALNLDTRV